MSVMKPRLWTVIPGWILLLQCLTLISYSLVSAFILEGSDTSYAQFLRWSPIWNDDNSLMLEFSTDQPDGLILYCDDGGETEFVELKLVEGSLRLRYNLGESGAQMMTVGRHLNDGLWHRAEIKVRSRNTRVSLTVDGFVREERELKISANAIYPNNEGYPVFIGGIPSTYNNMLNSLTLPSVAFEPRFRGAIRNLVYRSLDGIFGPQNIIESKGLVSGPREACEYHDPCEHGGFCISTDQGPLCDCKHIDFEGAFCQHEKSPAEATFRGTEYVGYDFRQRGGEPIVSTLDEVSFMFKTRHGHGLLFYTGDGVDYMSLTLREGRITISINLGSGPLDATIHPDSYRFDDMQWHTVRVHRKVQEITSSVDGFSGQWTLAGSFTVLSSNRATVGGFDSMRPIGNIKGVTSFVGCLKKVEYRADTLRLNLLELAKSNNPLVNVSESIQFSCMNGHKKNNKNEFSWTGGNTLGSPDNKYDYTGGKSTNNRSKHGHRNRGPGHSTNDINLNKYNGVGSSYHGQNKMKSTTSGEVTFTTPESFLILPPWARKSSVPESLSIKIRTTETTGLLLYHSSPNQLETSDFIALELVEGHLFFHINLGTGNLRVQATADPISDGEWHTISLTRRSRSGRISVDDVSTDFNTKGDSRHLDLDHGDFYLGGVPESKTQHFSYHVWTISLRKGFVGCVGALILNGMEHIDLSAIAQEQDSGSVQQSCQVGSAGHCVNNPCLNGGKCRDGWNRFICDCARVSFNGRVCQRVASTMTFDGTQFIRMAYQIPVKMEAQDIGLRFRTKRPEGLLLLMLGISIGQRTSDFVEISLDKGRVRLRVRLGHREKIILTGRELNDYQWHLIRMSRRGNLLRVQVDDMPPVSGDMLIRTWLLEVSEVFVGGLSYTSSVAGVPPPLMGHLQQLEVNGEKILERLEWGQIQHDKHIESTGQFKKYKPDDNIDKPVTFRSKYTHVEFPQLKAYSNIDLYFQLKTMESSGLLLYNGASKSKDFIALELRGGHLVYRFDLGSGVVTLRDNLPFGINDNQWHTVVIGRSGGMHTLLVDSTLSTELDSNHMEFLNLNGVLYLGGVPENRYGSLPKSIESKHGYQGCLATLDLAGESINPTADALGPSNMVVNGCEDPKDHCTKDFCSNHGICEEKWNGPACTCDMTSYMGPTCDQESVSYEFGPGRGLILFKYPSDRRIDTHRDSIAFGLITADSDAVLLRIDSTRSSDFLNIELYDGKLRMSYNMARKEHVIGEPVRRINDRMYHVIRIMRSGPNSTLQIDNWDTIEKIPYGAHEPSVFNDQTYIHVGGKLPNERSDIHNPFRGVISGLSINGLRPLDMATDGDPRVKIMGETRRITSIGSIPSYSFNTNELRNIQKTPGSTIPNSEDDSMISGEPECVEDDDEECEMGSATDDLITPVYFSTRPSTTHINPPVTNMIPCDDEDCYWQGSGQDPYSHSSSSSVDHITHSTSTGSDHVFTTQSRGYPTGGFVTTESGGDDSIFTTANQASNNNFNTNVNNNNYYDNNNYNNNIDSYFKTPDRSSTTSTTDWAVPRYRYNSTTSTYESNTNRVNYGTISSSSNSYNTYVDSQITTTSRPTRPTPPPTLWTPPTQYVPQTYTGVDSNLFDWTETKKVQKVNIVNTGIESGIKNRNKNGTENVYMADSGESTLIIIIIIAVLMIIIVSILIIFFMCKRRDDPIYKIDDKQRYEFVHPGPGGTGMQGRGAPPSSGSASNTAAGGGSGKQGVKEWYV